MGVEVQTIVPGDNKTYPKQGQKLEMHYSGTLASNGQVRGIRSPDTQNKSSEENRFT